MVSVIESRDLKMDMTDARLALVAKGAAEQDLARMAVCPPWRHAAFAGIMAMLVAAPIVPLPWRLFVLPIEAVAIILIVRSDRRRLGVFINGYRRGKTRLVTFPMLAVMLGLYALSLYCSDGLHRPILSLILGLVALPLGYYGSALWQRVFVRELGR